MRFNEINFALDILSPKKIISGKQNVMRLFVADYISNTNIATVEFRIVFKDGRNTPVQIVPYTLLDNLNGFYETSYTPTLTSISGLALQVRVTDDLANVYLLESTLEGVL